MSLWSAGGIFDMGYSARSTSASSDELGEKAIADDRGISKDDASTVDTQLMSNDFHFGDDVGARPRSQSESLAGSDKGINDVDLPDDALGVNPPEQVNEVSMAPSGLTSLGSALHPHDCRPCCFFGKGRCTNGTACSFCHEDHEKRLGRRKNRKGRERDAYEESTNQKGMDSNRHVGADIPYNEQPYVQPQWTGDGIRVDSQWTGDGIGPGPQLTGDGIGPGPESGVSMQPNPQQWVADASLRSSELTVLVPSNSQPTWAGDAGLRVPAQHSQTQWASGDAAARPVPDYLQFNSQQQRAGDAASRSVTEVGMLVQPSAQPQWASQCISSSCSAGAEQTDSRRPLASLNCERTRLPCRSAMCTRGPLPRCPVCGRFRQEQVDTVTQ